MTISELVAQYKGLLAKSAAELQEYEVAALFRSKPCWRAMEEEKK